MGSQPLCGLLSPSGFQPQRVGLCCLPHFVKGRAAAKEVSGVCPGMWALTEGPHSSRGAHEQELSLHVEGTGLAHSPIGQRLLLICETQR